jgi:hypothetical protein
MPAKQKKSEPVETQSPPTPTPSDDATETPIPSKGRKARAPAKKAPVKNTIVDKKKNTKDDSGDEPSDAHRNFKIVFDSIIALDGSPAIDPESLSAKGGRFWGKGPIQASKKAFSKIARASGKEECSYQYSIIETTRGRGSKKFSYIGKWYKLKEPSQIKKKDSVVNIYHRSEVRAYREEANIEGAAATKKSSKTEGGKGTKPGRKASVPKSTDDDNEEAPAPAKSSRGGNKGDAASAEKPFVSSAKPEGGNKKGAPPEKLEGGNKRGAAKNTKPAAPEKKPAAPEKKPTPAKAKKTAKA